MHPRLCLLLVRNSLYRRFRPMEELFAKLALHTVQFVGKAAFGVASNMALVRMPFHSCLLVSLANRMGSCW
jgi:hypothetical protein